MLKNVIGDLERAVSQLDRLGLGHAAVRVIHGLEFAKEELQNLQNGPIEQETDGNLMG
jgi:hypothetical protein